jgi:PAS domain S-box-containing protein
MIKILAIDDNQDNLISIKALISESFPDALVLSSLTGTKGLELAAAEDPDVIFLDIVMPGMDGFEVCKRLKTDKKLRDIPVVFVTALKSDKESRIRALESGAESFLAKPIDESELTAQIRAMVKIKKTKIEKHDEKKRLAAMVEKQTLELKQNHIATLNLMEDLRSENEARKKSEAALRESENNLKDIFQSVSEGIAYSTSSGKVISINKSLERILDISKENIVGYNILNLTKKLLSPKNFKNVLPSLSNLLMGKEIQPFLVEYKDKILEINTSRNHDNGRLTGVIRDITEQIQAKEQLQISNQRFKLHIQNTPLAFI